MAKSTSTKAFLDWIYSTSFEDIPPDVKQLALLTFYDAIGGNLACSLLPVAHSMVDFVKVVGGPPDCSIIGFPMRTSVLHAALVNGTLGHADEVDVSVGGAGATSLGHHIMAATMGAALAVGQTAGASGQEVVRAVVFGIELSKRINLVAARVEQDTGRGHSRVGHIDAGNTMAAVVAAGVALGLPPDQMDVALSLAAMMVCGITPFARETGHMAKSFVRGGVGARNGVAAALMAKVGYDAPRDIFDGPKGFFDSFLGVEEPGAEFLHGLGEDFGIREVVFKRYSVGSPNLAPRQALLEVMSENGVAADDIAEILAEVPPGNLGIMNIHYPAFEGRGMLALAALHGGVGFREVYQESMYMSPEAHSMRERITIQAREDWRTGYAMHAAVTVTTKDGKELRKETDYRRMNEEELDAKFSYLVGLRAGEAKAKELARVLKQLDTVNNIADVMVQLELPETSINEV